MGSWECAVSLEEELKGNLYLVFRKRKRYHSPLSAFYQSLRCFYRNWVVGDSLLSIVDSVGPCCATTSPFKLYFKFPALNIISNQSAVCLHRGSKPVEVASQNVIEVRGNGDAKP